MSLTKYLNSKFLANSNCIGPTYNLKWLFLLVNASKIFHGVFKHQILMPVGDDDDNNADNNPLDESGEKLKKKKAKAKESQWSKKHKADPNAPPVSRIPLPEMCCSVIFNAFLLETWPNFQVGFLESGQTTSVAWDFPSSEDHAGKTTVDLFLYHAECPKWVKFLGSHPFLLWWLNFNSICSCEFSEDSTLLCAGLGNSNIQVWSVDGKNILPLKKTRDLELLDKEAGKFLMMVVWLGTYIYKPM